MTRLRKSFRYSEKGFTLIELLVVVAILGTVVVIAVPNVADYIGSGEREARQAELHNVNVAVNAALSENATPGTLTVTYTDEQTVAVPSANDGDPAKYLINDTEYKYTVTSEGQVGQGDKVN